MKIELTIKTDYLPNWSVWHGLRELVQNAKDAETELGGKMSVTHTGKVLRIENEGAILPHEALLFGHTTKAGNSELIGKFGEGLKLGILALVRGGISVKIRSGGEVWVPSIEKSEKFNADVLMFDIKGGNKMEHRVSVEIANLAKEAWDQIQWKFRFIDPNPGKSVQTGAGDLLLGPEKKGHVFVKGIYVHTDAKLEYGYDIRDVQLDRDRKMIDPWDFRFKAKEILSEAATKDPELMKGLIKVLEDQTPEAAGFVASAPYTPEAVLDAVAADFASKYGTNAVPVKTLSESKELDHLGKKGVVVGEALASILTLKMPNVEKLKESLKEEVAKKYGWHDLTTPEQSSLLDAVGLINNCGIVGDDVLEMTLDAIDVVDFKTDDLRGLYKNGRVLLARKHVSDRSLCLKLLVHEIAHSSGFDGTKSHVETIEEIWSGVVEFLRTNK